MFIDFQGIKNARSLEDMELAGGRRLRPGRLLRSAHLGEATAGDTARLEEMGLRFIVDFRDPVERQRTPDVEIPGAEYRPLQALPTFTGRGMRDAAPGLPDFDSTFSRIYGDLSRGEDAKLAYRGFFRTLLEAKGEAVLWHCTQGKDRTGAAAILLLTALGASWEDIEQDYYLSNRGLEHMLREPMPEHMRRWPKEVREKLILVHPRFLRIYLEGLEQHWGGAMGYLRQAVGLGDAELEKLREYYTQS